MEKRIVLFTVFIFMLLCSIIHPSSAVIIDINIETDKQVYNVGDSVLITGNVTIDGKLVNDTLVAIEISDPYNNTEAPYVIRTVKTGENLSGYWKVQILALYTCDEKGNPKNLFNKGSTIYIFLRVKNVHTLTQHVKAALYTQYSDNTPFEAFYPFETDIEGGKEFNFTATLPIPVEAPSGETVIFASLFSDTPTNGGTAYCPENTTSFYIVSTAPSAQPQPQYFNITFNIPRKNVKLGNYTITARATYLNSLATDYKVFNIVLMGDIVKDGKIDMRDIGSICALYGKREGDPSWNPETDLYKDGIINMRDIGIECDNYGKSAIY